MKRTLGKLPFGDKIHRDTKISILYLLKLLPEDIDMYVQWNGEIRAICDYNTEVEVADKVMNTINNSCPYGIRYRWFSLIASMLYLYHAKKMNFDFKMYLFLLKNATYWYDYILFLKAKKFINSWGTI